MYLSKKVALVTGATRGIGLEIANVLASKGTTIIGTAKNNISSVKEFENLMKNNGYNAKGLLLDIANINSIKKFFDQIRKDNIKIDILINNAGIINDNLIIRMSEHEWQSVINTNLNSIFFISKECIRDMIKKRWGRIISIGSIVGSTGNLGQVNYCASKAGIIGFSKALAFEVAKRNITVNVISPGFINTDMIKKLTNKQKEFIINKIPLRKIGKPKDIASIVAFLASEEAEYITGQNIHVNGGLYMS